jgi:putative dimethyl sulfoxide reductase chaperone
MNSYCDRSLEDVLAYRYSVYDLLRRIFLWQFPLDLFTELVEASKGEQDENSSSPEASFRNYLRGLPTNNLGEISREIHIEYTRLFVGPRHLPAPPYESVYRSPDKLMMQGQTIDVRSFYAKNGFQVVRLNQEPDDMIGIELEFMCALSKASMDALMEEDRPRLVELVDTQSQFCDLHLMKWVPNFCQDIIDDSTSEFWKEVAVLARNFLDVETSELTELLTQWRVPQDPTLPSPALVVP